MAKFNHPSLVFYLVENWHACIQVVTIAQWLEHRYNTPGVEGSIPSGVTIFYAQIKWYVSLRKLVIWVVKRISEEDHQWIAWKLSGSLPVTYARGSRILEQTQSTSCVIFVTTHSLQNCLHFYLRQSNWYQSHHFVFIIFISFFYYHFNLKIY